ncbi:MAG: type II toxin-antitoxin system RatA family toxin [Candidatus Eutrophobiaceae bacterium]
MPWPADAMYRLVADIESYPEFLDWCADAAIIRRRGDVEIVRMGVRIGKFHVHLLSHNRNCLNERIDMDLEEWPFKRFQGSWQFVPHASGSGSDIALHLEFKMRNRFIAKTLSAHVGKMFEASVHSFVHRAKILYG